MNAQEQEIIEAVKKGDAEKVRQLLAKDRALVNARAETGESAILLAMYHAQRGIANLLWDYGSEMNVWEAASVGAIDRVSQLVEGDPSLIRSLSHDGFTPLQLAAFFGNKDVVEFLASRGADVNAVSRNTTFARGVPILQSAVASGNFEVVRALLEHGANPDVLNPQEGTPLFVAAFEGNADMVRLLLDPGADASLKTKTGETPLDAAKKKGHSHIAALLENNSRKAKS
jgi:ankyrin repeat protein